MVSSTISPKTFFTELQSGDSSGNCDGPLSSIDGKVCNTLSSLIDRRVFDELRDLKRQYQIRCPRR